MITKFTKITFDLQLQKRQLTIFCYLFFLSTTSFGQLKEFNFKLKDSISINQFYQEKLKLELEGNKINYKNNWLNYIPNIGITYDLQGNPRPSLSYNPASIFRANKERQKEKLENVKIINKVSEERFRELERLRIETEKENQIQELENNRIKVLNQKIAFYTDKLNLYRESFDIEKRLFEIQETKYNNNKISIEDYLKSKKTFIAAKIKIAEKETVIFELDQQKNENGKL